MTGTGGRVDPSPTPHPDLRAAHTDPSETSAPEVELDALPALGPLYRRAVGRSASGAIRGTGLGRAGAGARALPPTVLVAQGIRPGPERLGAYQHLVGEPVGDVLPAGFLHVLAFPLGIALMARPDFPLPLLGLVHLANRVEQRRAVVLGEALAARVHAQRLAPHRRGAAVDVVAEIAADGEVVWRGVSTYLAKSVRLPDAAPAPKTERPRFTPPRPTGRWRVGRDAGRRYATVSGDRNPIHTSLVAARAFGFARPIAHGMYTAARALADVGAAARGEAFAWEVAFATPLLLPSTVDVRIAPDAGRPGRPADPGALGGHGRRRGSSGYALAVWSHSGKPHLTGSVRPLG